MIPKHIVDFQRMLKAEITTFAQETTRSPCHKCVGAQCCCMKVCVSDIEARIILQTKPRLLSILHKQIVAQAEREANIKEYDVYFDAGVPCVFQNKSQRCMIYEDRPINCAVYWLHEAEDRDKCATGFVRDCLTLDFVCKTSAVIGRVQKTYDGLCTALLTESKNAAFGA